MWGVAATPCADPPGSGTGKVICLINAERWCLYLCVFCRKAVRAIIILIPLLGLQFILFPFRPEQDSGFLFAYKMLSAAVTSFQVN